MPTNEELRRLHEAFSERLHALSAEMTLTHAESTVAIVKAGEIACNELPRLLDEIEGVTADRDDLLSRRMAPIEEMGRLEAALAATDRRIQTLKAELQFHAAGNNGGYQCCYHTRARIILEADDRAAEEGANPDANQR